MEKTYTKKEIEELLGKVSDKLIQEFAHESAKEKDITYGLMKTMLLGLVITEVEKKLEEEE